jgi:hypothetical protein
MDNRTPYLSTISRPVPTIEARRIDSSNTWDYQIKFDDAAYLYLDKADMAALALQMVTLLFDDNTLDMATAERLNYLTHAALMDRLDRQEEAMMAAGEDF